MSDIGAYIRDIRKARNMTLRDVAERCGSNISHISDIEHGRNSPSLALLERIAQAFELELRVDFVKPGVGEFLESGLFREQIETFHEMLGDLLTNGD